MQRIYTLYGKLAEAHDEAVEFHSKTLQLLRDISNGVILPNQLRVTEFGWTVVPPDHLEPQTASA